jgi:hypothetical protein
MDQDRLDYLFERYRAACPDIEPGPNFMPDLWQKIDARQSFWSVFDRFGVKLTTASAAICLLLLALNLFFAPGPLNLAPTYMDALMAEHSAERTAYTEAIRRAPADLPPVPAPAR